MPCVDNSGKLICLMRSFTARHPPRPAPHPEVRSAPFRGKALRFSPGPFCGFRNDASAFADDPLNYGGLRSAVTV